MPAPTAPATAADQAAGTVLTADDLLRRAYTDPLVRFGELDLLDDLGVTVGPGLTMSQPMTTAAARS